MERIHMKRKVELGAQLYVNKYDNPEKLHESIRKIQKSGLTIFRIFIFWDIVEPLDNEWDFSIYDSIFDEAEKCGLSVIGTLWAVNPPGWMNITDTFRNFGDLFDSEFWSYSVRYIKKVVERYHKSPVLNAWISWKEAGRPLLKNPNSYRAFKEYLKKTYKDIEVFNHIYYNKYKSFDEIGLKPAYVNHEYRAYPDNLDWVRFSVASLCDKLREIYMLVRTIDKVHPIYMNPFAVVNNHLADCGQSVWSEAKEVDFLGLSNHPAWEAARLAPEPLKLPEPYKIRQHIAYSCDIIKSATPDSNGFYEVTEMVGGPSMIAANLIMTPSASDMQHYTWESIACGASRVLYWTFVSRNTGMEAGEWCLNGQDGEPTYRLNALTEVAKIIKKNQTLFDAAKPKKPDIWLLFSELSFEMAEMEAGKDMASNGSGSDPHNPRNMYYASDALSASYFMVADLGLQVQLINEEKVINGELPSDAVLIAPSVISVEDELCPALDRFVKNGGTLIVDHLFALKNKYGFIPDPEKNKAITDRIFGGIFADFISSSEDISINAGDYQPEGWFVKLFFKEGLGGEVIGRFDENNSPAVLKHAYGKGTAIRIGTVFFQRYLMKPTINNLNYLKSLLPAKLFDGIRLGNPLGSKLRLREMQSGKDRILILLNSGKNIGALLVSDVSGTLKPLNSEAVVEVKAGSPVVIAMAEGEVKQFVLSPKA